MNLIRFEIDKVDEGSGRPSGFFVVLQQMNDDFVFESWHDVEVREIIDFYNENLPVSNILEDYENRRALSWFKESAVDYGQKMWRLAEILKEYGVHVHVIRARYPRFVLYSDD